MKNVKYNFFRSKMYKEIYQRFSGKNKKFYPSQVGNYQPIYDWSKNPYIKLKYIYIAEIAALVSFICFKIKIKVNTLTLFGAFLALIGLVLLSLNLKTLNYLGLFIFFSKNVIDYADGFLARNFNMFSQEGKIYDQWSGSFYHICFFLAVPLYVFSKTNNTIYLFIAVILLLIELVDVRKLLFNIYFVKKLNINFRNSVLNKFKQFSKIKTKKNPSFKQHIIKFFSMLNYTGRTRYTDFMILVILIEIFYDKILISNFICFLWLFLSLLKFVKFFSLIEKK